MSAAAVTSIAGLIGYPLGHSLSPRMHNAAFAHFSIDARYELWETPADSLAAQVETLRAPHILGANVTLPHKIAVVPLLDRIEPSADIVGAINTIIREQDGTLTGTNTDLPAFLAALREDAGVAVKGTQAVVLGASGAARAAVAALLKGQAASVIVVNRTLEHAEALLGDALAAADYDPELIALATDDSELGTRIREAALVVNATSVGWHGDETPLEGALIPPGALVYDMVYRPTRLLREAAHQGNRTHDGLSMLARQAALAFARWTGQDVPLEVMLAAVRN